MEPSEILVDARGHRCPVPTLKLRRALEGAAEGARVRLLADDPMARIDIPLYCTQHGHACVVGNDAGALSFAIVKAL